MTTKPINPELILRCYKETHPNNQAELRNGCIFYKLPEWFSDGNEWVPSHFDTLTSADDREALMLVLMEAGWKFFKEYGQFSADSVGASGYFPLRDESFPMLLLLAASAEWNIPMYVTEGNT